MVQSADDVYQDRKEFNSDSDAYKTGVEIYFINNMIQHLGDFVLQEKSPYSKEGQQRDCAERTVKDKNARSDSYRKRQRMHQTKHSARAPG